ncbi:ferritin-like domain-containing protein [Desulfosoma sp.]
MASAGEALADLFCKALEVKEKKAKLYEEAMASCSDAVGRETFRILFEAEKAHEKALFEMQEALKAGQGWADVCRYVPPEEDLFARLAQRVSVEKDKLPEACTDEIRALETGVQLEEASIRLFEEKARETTDPSQKAFLDRLSSEEREHRRLLQDLKFYYTDPQGWFMEKSRARLDGAGAVT